MIMSVRADKERLADNSGYMVVSVNQSLGRGSITAYERPYNL